MKTWLQIIQAVQAELGLPVSLTVDGNTDATTVQMAALSNRVLDELRRMNRWTAMQFEFDLSIPAAISTTGDMLAGLAVITNIPSTAAFTEPTAWAVSGQNLLQASRIASVDSATQVTLTMENTNTDDVVGSDFIFGQDTFALPSGFDWYNNRTMWDRTNRWELLGPTSPQYNQWQLSGIIATGPRRYFRQVGPFSDKFRIWPPPFEITLPLQLVFEYLSLNAVSVNGSATVFAQYFENDDDVPLLDDQSIIMGIKWMFWEIKGFGSYVTAQSRWVDYVNRQIARDGGAATLSIVRPPHRTLLSSESSSGRVLSRAIRIMPTPDQMAQALMAKGAKKPKAKGEKIDCSAFLYLEGQDDTFAQCGSCAFGPDKCALQGGAPVDPEIGSCCLYVPGEPVGQPIAQLSKEEIGYVEHPVRCENCRYFNNVCELFAEINEKFPDEFALDEKVQPYGCCNGMMPNG